MKTIQKVSEETLAIENYLKDVPEGKLITYEEIAKECKVKMDTAGKGYMRTAIKRLRLEYSCIIGIGIQLADTGSASTIVVSKLSRIDSAVKRGEKSFNNISMQFYDRLESREQKQLNFIGAAFGAIRLAAENGKRILKEKFIDNNSSRPILPNV